MQRQVQALRDALALAGRGAEHLDALRPLAIGAHIRAQHHLLGPPTAHPTKRAAIPKIAKQQPSIVQPHPIVVGPRSLRDLLAVRLDSHAPIGTVDRV